MATEPTLPGAAAPASPPAADDASAATTATASPPPAAEKKAEKKMVVKQASRPFFFTASGERVELSPDVLAAAPSAGDGAELDPAALAALQAGEAPPAGAAPGGTPASGPPPALPADAKPIYAADGRQMFLSPGAAMRVAGRASDAPPAASPAPEADPAPTRPLAPLEPLAAVGSAAEPPAARLGAAAPAPPAVSIPGSDSASPDPAGLAGEASSSAAAVPSPAPAAPPVFDATPSPPPPVDLWREVPGAAEQEEAAPDELGRAESANVVIRSEELDEILTSMPGGLLRWGITAVFATLAVLLAISWFISYPDVVNGRIALTTPTPPARLVARAGGEVARVFAEDGARVKAGEPLVLLKSTADYADVRALKDELDRLEPALVPGGALPSLAFTRPLALGTLQSAYSALQQSYADYRLSRDQAFYAQRLASARAQVSELERLRGQLQGQQSLLEQQLQLSDRSRARTRELVERGLAAPAEVDKAEEEYLQRRYSVENSRASLSNNEVQLAQQRSALLDLEQRRSDEGERGLVSLRNAVHALRAAISTWEQENVLRAPVDGTVSFFRELHPNQYVGAAEPLVAVLPAAGGMIGQVTLSGQGAGKVKEGQRVVIRLDGYPYREYGTVEGRVERISQLGFQQDARTPDVTYQVEVSLPRGLTTNYDRPLEFRQEMRGEVDVVTEELRLLQRFFNQLRAVDK